MSDTITIMGNLAADPEQRMIGGGTTVTSFRVASSQRHFDKKNGKWVEKDPNWYQVSAFRDLGAHAYASLHKGERVIVSGRLKVRSWETENSKGTSVEIEADAVGHDLLWGTTQYTRVAGRSDTWNVPGQDAAAGQAAEAERTEQWEVRQPGAADSAAPSVGAVAQPAAGTAQPADYAAAPSAAPVAEGANGREMADTPF